MDRIKRIVQKESKRKTPKTIADILGTEDYEAYKDEIDLAIRKIKQE